MSRSGWKGNSLSAAWHFRQAMAPVTIEGARHALPADAALIEWFRYSPFDPKGKDD